MEFPPYRLCRGFAVLAVAVLLPCQSHSEEAGPRNSPAPLAQVVDTSGQPISNAAIRLDAGILQVSAPGYLPWSGPKGAKDPLRVVLQRAAAIRGQVRYQGQALPGFSVNLTGKQDSGNVAKTSSEEGFFEFTGLKPGLKTMKVELSGFIPQEHDEVLRE